MSKKYIEILKIKRINYFDLRRIESIQYNRVSLWYYEIYYDLSCHIKFQIAENCYYSFNDFGQVGSY